MPISCLITSGTPTPRYSATSLTVEPELTRTTSVELCAAVSSGAGPRVDEATAAATARTTARRATPGAAGAAWATGATRTTRRLRVDDDAATATGTGLCGPLPGLGLVALGLLGLLRDAR